MAKAVTAAKWAEARELAARREGAMSAREQGTYTPIPAGEATELPPEDGLAQWNLAVRLQDAPRAHAPVERDLEWALL